MQPDEFADIVVPIIKAAMTPVLERLAAAEARLSALPATEKTLTEIRDRVLVVETKSAMPVPVVEASPVDLAPVLARLAAVETRTQEDCVLCNTHDDALTKELGAVRDRLLSVEMRTPTRELWDALTDTIATLRAGVKAIEGRVQDDSLTKELGSLRERVVVLEVKAPVPGPPGPVGVSGRDGTLEQVKVDYDGHRTVTLSRKDGTPIEGGTLRLPIPLDEGPYQVGVSYEKGAVVTYDSSGWVAQYETTDQPGTSKAWRMLVKRGREGKPGRDGADLKPLPIVSVGRTQ